MALPPEAEDDRTATGRQAPGLADEGEQEVVEPLEGRPVGRGLRCDLELDRSPPDALLLELSPDALENRREPGPDRPWRPGRKQGPEQREQRSGASRERVDRDRSAREAPRIELFVEQMGLEADAGEVVPDLVGEGEDEGVACVGVGHDHEVAASDLPRTMGARSPPNPCTTDRRGAGVEERDEQTAMKSVFLRGRDHHRIGALALEGLGPVAVALSRGGARKTYDHTDPNEDCAAFALGDGGQLVIAADGHHGALGSEAATHALLTEFGARFTAATPPTTSADAWRELAFEALLRANRAVLEIAGQNGLRPAPTTLVLAVLRPEEDLLVHASLGDSHLFAIDPSGATELGGRDPAWKFTPFLGYEEARRELLERYSRVGVRSLSGLRAVALATDGLSERGIGVADPAGTVHACIARVEAGTAADLSALRACRAIAEDAMDAHRRQSAGDNLACSVVWLER